MSQVISTFTSTVPCEINAIEFRSLTEDKVEDALAIQLETMEEEVVTVAVGIYEEHAAPKEMQLFFREVMKDGCSVVGVDVNADKVVAVAFNKLHAPLNHGEKDSLAVFVENNISTMACLDLIKFVEDVESQVNLFERYNAKGTMEIFYAGSTRAHRGKGIGQKIVEASLQFARGLLSGEFQKVPVSEYLINESVTLEVAFAIFTSHYSQRIQKKLRFNPLFDIRYDERYTHDGKKFSERIGDLEKIATFAAIKL